MQKWDAPPRERPGQYKEQKKYYSGKKKSHTFKNQITVLPDGQDIVDVITGEPGPKSDITLFREGQQCVLKNEDSLVLSYLSAPRMICIEGCPHFL